MCTHMCCESQRLMSDDFLDCFSLYWGISIDLRFTDFGRLPSHLALGIPSLETGIKSGLSSLLFYLYSGLEFQSTLAGALFLHPCSFILHSYVSNKVYGKFTRRQRIAVKILFFFFDQIFATVAQNQSFPP